MSDRGERKFKGYTFPDSPAPSSNILISFFAIMRSRFSWFSISSLPSLRGQTRARRWWWYKGWLLTSLCLIIDASGLNATHF